MKRTAEEEMVLPDKRTKRTPVAQMSPTTTASGSAGSVCSDFVKAPLQPAAVNRVGDVD
jgi:hypothetical protein